MQTIRLINKLENKDRHLIDYANLKGGLLLPQKSFSNTTQFYKFLDSKYFGIPMLMPAKNNMFSYNDNYSFYLKPELIGKKIFSSTNLNYVGTKRILEFGNQYCTNVILKKNYQKLVQQIINHNLSIKRKVKKIANNGYSICAFQTRNIPHMGHELIISTLLKKFDYVVINPIIGPKKKGDVKPMALDKIFNFLIKNFYSERLIYMPVIANMFYAGPREACHHAIIRRNLGFTHFAVGRDHAGAENIYKPMSAINLCKKHEKKIGIKICNTKGAYFCTSCKKIILRNSCNHSINSLKEISGTQFRNHILLNKKFKYARTELQQYINKINNIFET